MEIPLLAGLLIVFVLLILSAFFSGTEAAFISLSELDIIAFENQSSHSSKAVLRLLSTKNKLLSTLLIGNNLINIIASAISTSLAIQYHTKLGISEKLSITIATLALTTLILIFGEILPKTLAIHHNVFICSFLGPVVEWLSKFFTPVVFLMEYASKLLLKLMPTKQTSSFSETTFLHALSKGEELGIIKATEKNMIQNVFSFDERAVYPIITPRTTVFALPGDLPLDQAADKLQKKEFSRIPIYEDNIDQITGIIQYKQVLQELLKGNKDKTLTDLAVKPLFIYETTKLTNVLETMQSQHSHMAIVVDEFGGMAGVVTLEDLMEELVGEIYDEKDLIDKPLKLIKPHTWIANGNADLATLNRELNHPLDENGAYETLQGLIMAKLERLPKVNDILEVENYHLAVLALKKHRILSVRITYIPNEDSNEDS